MESSNVSIIKNRLFPKFIQEEYPTIVDFIGAFFEWLGLENNFYYNLNNLQNFTDIDDVDNALEKYIKYVRDEYIADFPEATFVSKVRELIHKSLMLYTSKGTEASFDLYFKMIYGSSATIEYPWDNVLIVSGGKWHQDFYLQLDGVTDGNVAEDICGYNITDVTTGATAITDYYKNIKIDVAYYPCVIIIEKYGDFNVGDVVNINGKEYTIVSCGTATDADQDVTGGYWEGNYGLLDSSGRVIQDSNKYQKFSYTVQSDVDLSQWRNDVSKLIHPAGFLMFSEVVTNKVSVAENSLYTPVLNYNAHYYEDVSKYFGIWEIAWKSFFTTLDKESGYTDTDDIHYSVTDYQPRLNTNAHHYSDVNKDFSIWEILHDVYAWHPFDNMRTHVDMNYAVAENPETAFSKVLARNITNDYLFFDTDSVCLNSKSVNSNLFTSGAETLNVTDKNISIWRINATYPKVYVELSSKKGSFPYLEDAPTTSTALFVNYKTGKIIPSKLFTISSKTLKYKGTDTVAAVHVYRGNFNFAYVTMIAGVEMPYTSFSLKNIAADNVLIFNAAGDICNSLFTFGTKGFTSTVAGDYTIYRVSPSDLYLYHDRKMIDPVNNVLNEFSVTDYNNGQMLPFERSEVMNDQVDTQYIRLKTTSGTYVTKSTDIIKTYQATPYNYDYDTVKTVHTLEGSIITSGDAYGVITDYICPSAGICIFPIRGKSDTDFVSGATCIINNTNYTIAECSYDIADVFSA